MNSIGNDNLQSIANMIQDYQYLPDYVYTSVNEIGDKQVNLDCLKKHISKWVGQFDETDRDFVLDIVNKILSKYYVSKMTYKKWFDSHIYSKHNQSILNSCNKHYFLKIQSKSNNSQLLIIEELNKGFLASVNKKFEVWSINDEQKANLKDAVFHYLDDISFSGDRIIQDIRKFANMYSFCNITVFIYVFIVHSYGCKHIKDELGRIEEATSGLTLKFSEKFPRRRINNSAVVAEHSKKSEVFLLEKNVVTIPENPIYIPRYYREGFEQSDIFKDSEERNRIEKIFTEKGFDIIKSCDNPKEQMKPLGYSWFNGFGFGGVSFSYRNCANNTPLVFWWGNYEQNTGKKALDYWYPLFKRCTYND